MTGDDVGQQVSRAYPYPLAFGYSLLRGQVRPIELYREQLRVAENILAFLGSLSLALVETGDRAKLDVDLESCWQGGISPGHWKSIVDRCSRVFGGYGDQPLARDIAKLNVGSEKRGFGKDVVGLIRAKNDFKHERGPSTDEDLLEATRAVGELLRSCLEALAFLTDHPVREVRDIDVDRADRTIKLTCLRHMGESPGHEMEELRHPIPQPRGDLYVEVGPDRWVALYPFMLAINCTRCKAPETSFVDRWSRRDATALLKSFERGHTQENPGVGAALNVWQGQMQEAPTQTAAPEASARPAPPTPAPPARERAPEPTPKVASGVNGHTARPLAGLSLVVTGRLDNYTRHAIHQRIADLGGSVRTSVSRDTDYALVGADPGTKLRQAQDLGIPLLDEAGFEALVRQLTRQATPAPIS